MKFSTSYILTGLVGICAAAPADQVARAGITVAPKPPPSCSLYPTEKCYTYTQTTSPGFCQVCPKLTGLMCLMIIKVTSITVPCSTDCCQTTPTVYKTTACPTCPTGCVIPTETITVTTGCPKTPVPTQLV